MRIEAITCCVGQLYADQLSRSLEIWCNTLDSLVVVTKHGDPTLDVLESYEREFPTVLRHVTSDLFDKYGAHFNKGAALCEAYRALDPVDWVLHFDSDIIPPDNWREITERSIRIGNLYGCPRVHEDGRPGDTDKQFHPFGYFQLWHISDPRSWRWPIFDPWHPHAGSYDANFMDQWPRNYWRKLPFSVIHQGEPRRNWFGSDKPELMQPLLKRGLLKYRMDCNRGRDRLEVPEPRLRFQFSGEHRRWTVDVIRACMIGGPFDVELSRTKTKSSIHITPREWPFTRVQEEVLRCKRS